ncbi:MAG TPA: hypothetical protein VF507_04100, partial [Pyrinomonadaceae bacterium]
MKPFLCRAFSAFALALLVVGAVRAQDRPAPRLITVTGEAEVNVVPDEVFFDVTVSALSKDMRQAKT